MISEYKDVVVTNRINNLEKWLNWDEKSDKDQFKNFNIKESKIILSWSESEDKVC